MTPRARIAAAALASLGWASLALQVGLDLERDLGKGLSVSHTLWHEASYYTILTNLLTASALTLAALGALGAAAAGAVTVYETLLGILNHALLGGIHAKAPAWFAADLCLHYVLPVLVLAYWISLAPKRGLRPAHAALWTAYPLGYGAYTLVRGSFTGRYPYFFVDAGRFGLGRVLLNFGALALVFALTGLILVAASRPLSRSMPTTSSTP